MHRQRVGDVHAYMEISSEESIDHGTIRLETKTKLYLTRSANDNECSGFDASRATWSSLMLIAVG